MPLRVGGLEYREGSSEWKAGDRKGKINSRGNSVEGVERENPIKVPLESLGTGALRARVGRVQASTSWEFLI